MKYFVNYLSINLQMLCQKYIDEFCILLGISKMDILDRELMQQQVLLKKHKMENLHHGV